MNIGIIGCGGVGGYIGAKIIQSYSAHVDMTARGEHLKSIKKNGLHIIDEDETFKIPETYINKTLNQDIKYDIVIFCTKTYDLENACKENLKFIDQNTLLLSLNNGVDNDLIIKEKFPNNSVAKGCIYILSNITKPGVIKKYGGVFNLFFGITEKKPDILEKFQAVLKKSSLKHRLSDNIDYEIWRKFLLISAFASLTSYYDITIGEIGAKHKNELSAILDEIILLANKKNIPLGEKEKENVIKRVNTIPYESTTSMLLDFRAKKKTELEALCGYVVKEAEKVGLKVPVMSKIYEKLKTL